MAPVDEFPAAPPKTPAPPPFAPFAAPLNANPCGALLDAPKAEPPPNPANALGAPLDALPNALVGAEADGGRAEGAGAGEFWADVFDAASPVEGGPGAGPRRLANVPPPPNTLLGAALAVPFDAGLAGAPVLNPLLKVLNGEALTIVAPDVNDVVGVTVEP